MTDEKVLCPMCGVEAEKIASEVNEKDQSGTKYHCPLCGYDFFV